MILEVLFVLVLDRAIKFLSRKNPWLTAESGDEASSDTHALDQSSEHEFVSTPMLTWHHPRRRTARHTPCTNRGKVPKSFQHSQKGRKKTLFKFGVSQQRHVRSCVGGKLKVLAGKSNLRHKERISIKVRRHNPKFLYNDRENHLQKLKLPARGVLQVVSERFDL